MHAAAGRAVLEALVDVGEGAGAGGPVLGEDEAVHAAEERAVDGEHEEAVDVLAELGWVMRLDTIYDCGIDHCKFADIGTEDKKELLKIICKLGWPSAIRRWLVLLDLLNITKLTLNKITLKPFHSR